MEITTLILLAAGIGLLIVGAEALVRGGAKLAAAVGISPLVIGLTIVALGTSSPELAISIKAGLAGEGDIVLGNVVGSNILNVLLILGLSALITPLVVAQQLVRLDVPVMITVSVLLLILARDGLIGRWDGVLLVAGIIAYIIFAIYQSRKESQPIREEYAQEFGDARLKRPAQWLLNIGLIMIGLASLVVGARWLLQGALALARALGLGELIIGLTVVAMGTSLPEIATSVIASLRGERDIAVGNVVGSNIFNILAVLGSTAVISPNGIGVSKAALAFDIPVMIAVAVACLPIFFTSHLIARWEGALFAGYYLAYTLYLILDAVQHDALPYFSVIMLAFVIPLTAITVLTLALRALQRNRRWRELGSYDSGSKRV